MNTHFNTNEAALKARNWLLVDAENQVVGRLASRIAAALRGKNNPSYSPHNDDGSFVVVINAEKIRFTGKKLEDKEYYRHSGYIGGLRSETPASLLARKATRSFG